MNESDRHPLRKVPGTGRATWDSWMGRWVVLPHIELRQNAHLNYALKMKMTPGMWEDDKPMVKKPVNREFAGVMRKKRKAKK